MDIQLPPDMIEIPQPTKRFFTWMDKQAAIRRVSVIVSCQGLSFKDAIRETLYKPNQTYCKHPDMIREQQHRSFEKECHQYHVTISKKNIH